MDGAVFTVPIQVRWRDLDAFEHVNNAVYASWIEVARAELWRARFGGLEPHDIPFVIARLEIEYRRPVALYDRVEIGIGVAEVRGSSFTFTYRIEANGALAATARTVQAVVDGTTGRPVRIAPAMRATLETLRDPSGG